MRRVFLGHDMGTGGEVYFPAGALETHLHMVGGTGKGKTTAIQTLLHPLLADHRNRSCFFIIDRLGNFSQELLLWMCSRFCPRHVRDRLVYIEGANESAVPTFNPLRFRSEGECYFRVERTTDIILRAWASQDVSQMPRLARWTFNAFMAAAHLGLTVADCGHFLMPGSPYHAALLALLPPMLRAEWREIMASKGEATRILDSSRNRLKPYFENASLLRRMFGSTTSRLDVPRMMREGRIVLVDLAPKNRLSEHLGDTIGALLINEILATARSLPRGVLHPTYLLLDEFQNFVGPDIQSALPEVRQLGLRLILSHQSFSQLERGDCDLTSLIWQAQSRMIFGLQGEDADILSQEMAALTFDPKRVKEELYSRRQLIRGHSKVELASWSDGEALASQWAETYGRSSGSTRGESDKWFGRNPTISTTRQESENRGGSRAESHSLNRSRGGHEALVPVYDEFLELASRTYYTFDEQRHLWGRIIRRLTKGEAIVRLVDDPAIRTVKVKRHAPGFLAHDRFTIARRFPEAYDEMDRLIEENFRSEFFAPAAEVDRECDERVRTIIQRTGMSGAGPDVAGSENSPFGT
jgi:hypothetical protein